MRIFYIPLLVVIIIIAIDFLILSHSKTSHSKTSYNKPRMDNMKILEGFYHPRFFVDFPSPHDKILSYNESLYGDFANE